MNLDSALLRAVRAANIQIVTASLSTNKVSYYDEMIRAALCSALTVSKPKL